MSSVVYTIGDSVLSTMIVPVDSMIKEDDHESFLEKVQQDCCSLVANPHCWEGIEGAKLYGTYCCSSSVDDFYDLAASFTSHYMPDDFDWEEPCDGCIGAVHNNRLRVVITGSGAEDAANKLYMVYSFEFLDEEPIHASHGGSHKRRIS
jgi:hypothetical protein